MRNLCLCKKYVMAVQVMLQEIFSPLNNKMYRLDPEASSGFCGLN